MPCSRATILYDLYETDRDGAVRYALGRAGPRPLLVVGLNPSTADQYRRDQTLARVEGFARRRAAALIMCNLYPLRATDPDDLPDLPDAYLMAKNAERITALCAEYPAREIWAAWGDPIAKRPYLFDALRLLHAALAPRNPRWLRCGPPTAKGHPRHPSRLGYKHRFAEFPIARYLADS